MTILEAVLSALLGYGVVFFGLALLLVVVVIMGKVMSRKKAAPAPSAAPAPAAAQAPAAGQSPEAPGSAGEVRLYSVSDKDAALLMAIVAHKLGKPLNQLRFKSIKEVK